MVCQPGRSAIEKSNDTIVWTETNTGRISADSKMPAMAWNRHCRAEPWNPSDITA